MVSKKAHPTANPSMRRSQVGNNMPANRNKKRKETDTGFQTLSTSYTRQASWFRGVSSAERNSRSSIVVFSKSLDPLYK